LAEHQNVTNNEVHVSTDVDISKCKYISVTKFSHKFSRLWSFITSNLQNSRQTWRYCHGQRHRIQTI